MSPSESYIIRECVLWPVSKKGRRESETRNVECVQGVGIWEAQLGKEKTAVNVSRCSGQMQVELESVGGWWGGV